MRVKFTWERYNPADETSSCWIRVSRAWTDTGFGNLVTPRVGQEMIVDFLNGNPNQPVNISQFQNTNVKTDVTQFNGGSRIQQSAGEVVMAPAR